MVERVQQYTSWREQQGALAAGHPDAKSPQALIPEGSGSGWSPEPAPAEHAAGDGSGKRRAASRSGSGRRADVEAPGAPVEDDPFAAVVAAHLATSPQEAGAAAAAAAGVAPHPQQAGQGGSVAAGSGGATNGETGTAAAAAAGAEEAFPAKRPLAGSAAEPTKRNEGSGKGGGKGSKKK